LNELDEREFREYVASRNDALFRVAMLLAGHREDAEDLLQTVLTKLALHWNRAAKATSVDAYVRRVLYNQQVSWWRSRGRQREYIMADPPDLGQVSDLAGESALRITLATVLAKLTMRQRAVIVLRYCEDLPEAEVAAILGCSVGTLNSR
jgi:RNA polymerase sigma-70 factor (sigma-E family)